MTPTFDRGAHPQDVVRSGRLLWLVLTTATGICLSTVFACATPFAAIATVAALKLTRRDSIVTLALIWAANQVVGYGFLGYPRTWDSLCWGAAIGVSTGLAFLVARGLSASRPAPFMVSLPFIGAFAAFEMGLYGAGIVLPGSQGAFAASVVWHVFLINAIALCAIMVVYHSAMLVGSLFRHDPTGYRPAGA